METRNITGQKIERVDTDKTALADADEPDKTVYSENSEQFKALDDELLDEVLPMENTVKSSVKKSVMLPS